MNHFAKKICLLILLMIGSNAYSQVILLGPTIHYNFGGGSKSFSWGIEASSWISVIKGPDSPPIGLDLGVEFERGKLRLYSELESGMMFGGSVGYAHEFTADGNTGGLQCSMWLAVFGGIEWRYRRMNKQNYFVTGGFLKLPVYVNFPQYYGHD
jgi:hypothetical protein